MIRTGPTTSAAPGYELPEDHPLEDGIEQDAHEQEVGDRPEAVPHELTAVLAIGHQAQEVWRPSRPRVSPAAPDSQDRRDQRLQDEPEATGAHQALRQVLDERA